MTCRNLRQEHNFSSLPSPGCMLAPSGALSKRCPQLNAHSIPVLRNARAPTRKRRWVHSDDKEIHTVMGWHRRTVDYQRHDLRGCSWCTKGMLSSMTENSVVVGVHHESSRAMTKLTMMHCIELLAQDREAAARTSELSNALIPLGRPSSDRGRTHVARYVSAQSRRACALMRNAL